MSKPKSEKTLGVKEKCSLASETTITNSDSWLK